MGSVYRRRLTFNLCEGCIKMSVPTWKSSHIRVNRKLRHYWVRGKKYRWHDGAHDFDTRAHGRRELTPASAAKQFKIPFDDILWNFGKDNRPDFHGAEVLPPRVSNPFEESVVGVD